MSIQAPSVLTSVASQTDATSYASGSVTPTAQRLLLLLGAAPRTTSDAEVPSSISAWSLTWDTIGTFAAIAGAATNRIMFAYAALSGNSPGSGTATVSFTNTHAGCEFYVIEVAGVDTSSGSALGCIRDQGSGVYIVTGAANTNGTSISASALAAAANAANRPFAWGFVNQNSPTDLVPRTNWTQIGASELAHNNPASTLMAQYRSDTFETASSMSWAANANQRAIAAFEVKAALGFPYDFNRGRKALLRR